MRPRRMIFGKIPNNVCNLRCKYCYISQLPDWARVNSEFKYEPQYIARCLSPNRLGGNCIINMTGDGETMLQPQLVELCELLLEQGHYLEIVTNLTVTKVVNEFMSIDDDLLKHVEFKVSLHYSELKRRNMLDHFTKNLRKVQDSPASFALELMPNDDDESLINEIRSYCKEIVGADCQVTVGRRDDLRSKSLLTKHSMEEFKKIWSVFKSPMFDIKMKLFGEKRREFCYAGCWTLHVDLYTGEARPCYSQPYRQDIFKDPNKPINFVAVGHHCTEPFCFNGHAHICLGVIPELEAPSFAEIRNRIRDDGTEWLSPEVKECYSTRLCSVNQEYGSFRKIKTDLLWYAHAAIFFFSNPAKVRKRMRLHRFRKRTERQERKAE